MTEPGLPIPPHRTPAGRAEKLIPAMIFMLAAICLIGLELLTVVMGAWPIEPFELQWRVQVFTLLLSATPQILFLVTLIAVAAVYAGKHRAVRAAAVAYCGLAVALVILAPLFAMDSLSMRHLQPPDKVAEFTYNMLRLCATSAFLVPFMVWAGVKSVVGAASPIQQPITEGARGHGLIVGGVAG